MNPLATWPVTSMRCSRFASEPPNPPRARRDSADVVVVALVVREAAFDALEVAGVHGQAMYLEERHHRLGGIQFLAVIRRGLEEDPVRAILSLLSADAVGERGEPLEPIWKVRVSQRERVTRRSWRRGENSVMYANFFMPERRVPAPDCFVIVLEVPQPTPHAIDPHEATGLPSVTTHTK